MNVKDEIQKEDCEVVLPILKNRTSITTASIDVDAKKFNFPPAPSRLSKTDKDDDVLFVKAERIHRPVVKNSISLKVVATVKKHINMEDEEPIQDPLRVNRSFPCSHCKKIFSSAQHLIAHVDSHNRPKKRLKQEKTVNLDDEEKQKSKNNWTCSYCGVSFEKEKSLAGHLHIHKGRVAKNAIKCKDCPLCFNSKGSLWNHRKKLHTETLFKCSICTETFITECARDKHVLRHEKDICDVCGKTFPLKDSLKIHMRTHSDERPFLCGEPLCGKSFNSNLALMKHARRHKGETRHSCHCGKQFYEKTELRKHAYTHTKDKPHKCDICLKGFVFPASMREHRRTHTGEKPFKCDYNSNCQKCFRNLTQLKRHIIGVHKGEKPHKCQECSRAFLDKGSLKEHTKRMHKIVKTLLHNCTVEGCYFAFDSPNDLRNHLSEEHSEVILKEVLS